MERLTDRKTAADLAANYKALQEAGQPRDIETERYIKLAEYENAAEEAESAVFFNGADGTEVKPAMNMYFAGRFLETR